MRNPKDSFISAYNFIKNLDGVAANSSLEQFFNLMFLKDGVIT